MRAVLRLTRRAVVYELKMYRSLFRWLTRRRPGPSGSIRFAYVGAVAFVIWAFIILSAVEFVGFHLIIPWETVRLAVDVLSLWGLVWMLGYFAGLKVHPHLVTDIGLRVRNGVGVDIEIPWVAIAEVRERRRSREKSRGVQLDRDESGTVLNVVVGGGTNVDIALRSSVLAALPKGPETVTAVRLYADDPRGLVTHVRGRLVGMEAESAQPPGRR
jgi:hypothetical protein